MPSPYNSQAPIKAPSPYKMPSPYENNGGESLGGRDGTDAVDTIYGGITNGL